MSYSTVANYMYSSMIDASNSLTNGTYGNVSLLTFGNAELGRLSVKNTLGVGCNHPSSYLLDVSGSCWVRGDLDISGNLDLSPTSNIFSSWLDSSLNARALDSVVVKTSGDQTIGGNKTLTGILNTDKNIVVTSDTTREIKITNTSGLSNCSITQGAMRCTNYFWCQNVGGDAYRGTTSANANFYVSNDELSYLQGITSSVQTQLNAKAATSNVVTLTGAQTISGAKQFTGDVSFNTGTLNFNGGFTATGGTVNGSLVGMLAMRMSGGSVQTNGGLYYPSSDLRRKLTLAPGGAGNNDFQQFSIGTIGAAGGSGSTIYNVPSGTTNHLFTYGTSSTTVGNILLLNATSSTIYTPLTFNNGTTDCVKIKDIADETGGIDMFQGTNLTMYSGTTNQKFKVDALNSVIDISNMTMNFYNTALEKTLVLDGGGVNIRFHKAFKLWNATNTHGLLEMGAGSTNFDSSGINHRVFNGQIRLYNTTLTESIAINPSASVDISGIDLVMKNNGQILKENMYLFQSNSASPINGNTTISKPFKHSYTVESTGTAFTITLPTIADNDDGNEIIIRKVRTAAGTATISFIGDGTQNVYGFTNTGGTTAQGIMTSTVYVVRFLALREHTGDGSVKYAWFAS